MGKTDRKPCVYESSPNSVIVYDVMGFGCGCGHCDLSENAGRITKIKYALLKWTGLVKEQTPYRFSLNVETSNGHEAVLGSSTNGMTEAALPSFKKPSTE